MRLAAQAKGGFYPTPPRVVDLIAGLVQPPAGYYQRNRETLRILDPCCGAGEAVEQLAERLNGPNTIPIETYGVELHRDRAGEAERRLDRVLAADLFATSIANGAFGLLYLNPPYDWDREDRRVEHAFLTHCTRYLAEHGLLVLIVPRPRLTVSARYLSTHYGRLRCWAFPRPEREVFDQVVLMGYRKPDPVPDAYAEDRVRRWAEGEPPPLRSHTYAEFSTPTTQGGDILFATRTDRSGCGGGGGPAVGAVDQHGDNRHPLARKGQPHPPADATATWAYGDAGGGRFPRQPLPRGRRATHPGKGTHLEGDGPGGRHAREGGPSRAAQDHRGGHRPR